jgi:hypothetical protein
MNSVEGHTDHSVEVQKQNLTVKEAEMFKVGRKLQIHPKPRTG